MLFNRLKYKVNNWIDPPKYLEDDFIKWLLHANAGMLHLGNVYAMNYAIERLPSDGAIVEIGSFCGLSTNAMTYLIKKNNKTNKLYSADKWIFVNSHGNEQIGNSEISHLDYKSFVKESFIKNTNFFSPTSLPHTIELFSDEFFIEWNKNSTLNDVFNRTVHLGGPIAFSYIDGDHSYESTKRDFLNVDEHLELGGYVLFDDTSDLSAFGCRKFMSDMNRNDHYKLIMKNPNHLFQKIKN